MVNALTGHWWQLGFVAIKAALLFAVAVVGLRLSARRTLAELSVFDFVTAVAVGAVVGRVPNSSTTSFAAGAVTLAVVLVTHRLLGTARIMSRLGRVLDHRPAILVHDGRIDAKALRRTQLTADDVASMLRSRGVLDLGEVEYVIFEPGGALSIVRPDHSGELVTGLVESNR
jgi:uncharacterized membrane protein YcaP (DUF421 family)